MRRDYDPPPKHGWLVEFLLNIVSEPEVIGGIIRFCGHVLLLAVRGVFHLLTCHF